MTTAQPLTNEFCACLLGWLLCPGCWSSITNNSVLVVHMLCCRCLLMHAVIIIASDFFLFI